LPIPVPAAASAGGFFPPAIAAALAARKYKSPGAVRLDQVQSSERQLLVWLQNTAMGVLHNPKEPSVLLLDSEALDENLQVMDRTKRESGRRLLVPPPWERTSTPIDCLYFDLELRKGGPVSAFTLRLSHDRIAALSSTRHGFGRALQDYLVGHLEQTLGFVPDFWFVIEADLKNGHQPHLHACIKRLPNEKDYDRVRLALRKAAGMTGIHGFESNKLRLRQPHDLMGWSAYSTKGLQTTRDVIKKGRLIYATRAVRQGAAQIYEKHRAMMAAMPSAKGRPGRPLRLPDPAC
jgi:hypothetical protein